MSYEEFLEKLKQTVHEKLGCAMEDMHFYPKGYTSDDPDMLKWISDCNLRFAGEMYSRLLTDIMTIEVVGQDDLKSIQRVATYKVYENALQSGFDAAFEDIAEKYRISKNAHVDKERLEARVSDDYEKIRDQLILRPLNYGLHIQDLHGYVYKKIGDFVLCLYQGMQETERDLLTSKIRRSELKKWGMQGRENEVIKNALDNTARLYPACVYDQRTNKEENFLEGEFTRDDISMKVMNGSVVMLSTERKNNGAAALFYPGVIDKMMKIMGGPFQAVFMNTTDVMIFDSTDRRAISFAEVAKKPGEFGEMLSGKIYLCDGKDMIPGIVLKLYEDGSAELE